MKTVRERIEDAITPDMMMARRMFCDDEIQLTQEEKVSLTMSKFDFPKINPMPYVRLRDMKNHKADSKTVPFLRKNAIEIGLTFSF